MFNLNSLLPGQIKPASTDPRKRFRISAFQVQALEDVFKSNPRPCKEIQEEVASRLHLPYRTVAIWFQNRRAKAKSAGEPLAGHVFQWKPPVVSVQPTKPKEKPKEKPVPEPIPAPQPIDSGPINANFGWADQPLMAQPDWPYLDSASYMSGDFGAGDFVAGEFGFTVDPLAQPSMDPFMLGPLSQHSDSASFYNLNFYSHSVPQFPQKPHHPFHLHPAQSAPILLDEPNPHRPPIDNAYQNDAMFFALRS
ncbi:hypothetical protein L0F63_006325 [Massospora cicadina]|nr:hypothetical protein L0F63_006325 [Massospora cicadina]